MKSTITEIDLAVVGYLAKSHCSCAAVGDVFLSVDAELDLTTVDFNRAISHLVAAGLIEKVSVCGLSTGEIALTRAGEQWNERKVLADWTEK